VRNYEFAGRRSSAIKLGRPTAGSTLIRASSAAQKAYANYCTICCTIPACGGWLPGIIRIPSSQRE
jgi:hypothetical protein